MRRNTFAQFGFLAFLLLTQSALADRQQVVHVLNRLAFGPRPGDVQRVEKIGWRAWAERQLRPESIADDDVEKRLKQFPSLSMSMAQAYRGYRPPKDYKPATPREKSRLEQKKQRMRVELQNELREAVIVRAVFSERQFNEVIVNFWRNHLNVDQKKSPYWAAHYEEHVIRQHAFGKFEDLILASAKHPAMLVYLDNHVSRKDNLNENYARELMELHTLGVDRGYTQRDVIELARVLTGWTCFWRYDQDKTEHWRFVFRPEYHDTKPATVVGMRVDGMGGVADGERVIRYLANHENTADYVSQKLCQYLVNDNPPDALVKHVAAVFRSTDGDLSQVYRAIVFSREFMEPSNVGAKYKTPFEFVVSALRATGANIVQTKKTLEALDVMAQPLYQCSIPTGYDDRAESWTDPGALVYRWDFALRLAEDRLIGVKVGDDFLKTFKSLSVEQTRRRTIDAIAPLGVGKRTEDVLTQTNELRRTIGLMLGSPEFQQQ